MDLEGRMDAVVRQLDDSMARALSICDDISSVRRALATANEKMDALLKHLHLEYRDVREMVSVDDLPSVEMEPDTIDLSEDG